MKIIQNNLHELVHRAIPPQLELPSTHFEKIRNGARGIVFKLSPHYAGKVLYEGNCFKDTENFRIRHDSEAYEKLLHESDIALSLYDYECNAPKPVGVEMIQLFPSTSSTYPVYIMDFLPYQSGADLGYYEFLIARKAALNEIAKTIDCGFSQTFPEGQSSDILNPNNFLWDRANKKVYLIDFEFWMFNQESEKYRYTANL